MRALAYFFFHKLPSLRERDYFDVHAPSQQFVLIKTWVQRGATWGTRSRRIREGGRFEAKRTELIPYGSRAPVTSQELIKILILFICPTLIIKKPVKVVLFGTKANNFITLFLLYCTIFLFLLYSS